MSDLPKGWLECQLGEVVEYGKTNKIEPIDIPENTWMLELEDIEKDTSKLLKRLSFSERLSKSTKNCFKKGDVLYGKLRPYLNKVIIADQAGFCTTEIVPISPNSIVYGGYLFYWFKNSDFLEYVESVSHGIQMPRLGTEAGLKAPFRLAPLAEQKRIVTKLDNLFAHTRLAREELDHIPKLIERYKQAILSAAFRGDLTADWRKENLFIKSASEILEGIQVKQTESSNKRKKITKFNEITFEIENTENFPTTWKNCQIGNIGDVCNGSTPSRKSLEYWNGEINWVSSGEVRNNVIYKTKERITQSGYDNSSVRLLPSGTVLLAMIGEGKTRGQTAILKVEATINQNIAAVVIDQEFISSDYLWYWFRFQYESTREFGSGSGPQALNCQRVRELPFILCPLEEQKEIVKRVENYFQAIDRLEQEYQKAVKLCNRLEQSTLAKAFRGELVPQDPNDEPASLLLERIQKERENQKPPKKKQLSLLKSNI